VNGIVTGSVDVSMTPSSCAAALPLALATGVALAVAAAEEAAAEGVLVGDELPVDVELHAASSSAAPPIPATSVVSRVDRTL
jgi:multidrug resistance efflux pump